MTMILDEGSQQRVWVTRRPPAQESFYAYWLAEWNDGRAVDVEGNTEYVDRYVMEVLQRPLTTARGELDRLLRAYVGEQDGRYWLIQSCTAAAAIADGDFAEALKIYEDCYGYMSPYILSLRLALGTPPTGSELAAFAMLDLNTKFRSKFADVLPAMYGAAFEKEQVKRGVNLLQLWARDCPTKKWPNIDYFDIDQPSLPRVYDFFSHPSARDEVLHVLRGVEAEFRAQLRR